MAVITVSNSNDLANGSVGSVDALLAGDGGDGISLREALLAANATPGAHTIVFAQALAGHTIEVGAALPAIVNDGLTVQGLMEESGPLVTLDFSGVLPKLGMILLPVHASGITIAGLGFRGMLATHVAIFVEAVQGAPLVEGVIIRDCVFEPLAGQAAYAIRIGTNVSPDSVGLTVRDVRVLDNAFNNFGGDATTVHLQAAGSSCAIESVVVQGNLMTACTYGVELVVFQSDASSIENTLVNDNRFVSNHQPVSLFGGGGSINSTISGTVITGNQFLSSGNSSISINAGAATAQGNQVVSTTVANNLLIDGERTGIWIGGGAGLANAVNGLLVTNNTITSEAGGLFLVPNEGSGQGNSVSGLVIQNTIFQKAEQDFGGPVTPEMVFNCLLSDNPLNASGQLMQGLNGNIVADAQFIDAGAGDYRLGNQSPAIDAGRGDNTLPTDFTGGTRIDDLNRAGASWVDIGAYEFAGGPGDDMLDFGPGLQELQFSESIENFDISRDGEGIVVDGPQGRDILFNLERLEFADFNRAFDLADGNAAGQTVRVIGAMWGKAAIEAHPEWVGLGLEAFDSGTSLAIVCDEVVQLMVLDNEEFVSRVFTNLVGVAPTEYELLFYMGGLAGSGGSMTQGEMLSLAAESDYAAGAIDLPALQLVGVLYL